MKSTIAYYLLILYTLAMCKPILPLVQNELAHIFWKAEHLATVHQHYGNHHAEVELIEAAHEEETSNTPTTTNASEPVSVHIIIQTLYNIPHSPTEERRFAKNDSNFSTIFLNKQYPPPKS